MSKNLIKKQHDKTILEFNNDFRKLLLYIEQIDKNDQDLKILRGEATQGLKINEEYVIRSMGPILYHFRIEIIKMNIEYFLNSNFSEFSPTKDTLAIIDKVKKMWKGIKQGEQDLISKLILNMLSKYIEILTLDKSLK